MAGGEFAHFAGADEEDAAAFEGSEDFAGEFDGGEGDGDGAFADGGFGADAFGDVEGAGENGIEILTEDALLFGQRPGFFQLAEDLGFADDHGVQRRSYAEEMANGVAIFEVIEVAGEVDAVAGFGVFEEAGDAVVGIFLFVSGDDDFDAVAGGEDEAFVDAVGAAEEFESTGERGRVKGKTLTHFYGRGAMIQACDVELHLARRGRRPVCETQVRVLKRST